jgi:adenine C2-methylase RlmN of 23S rRNA A2503 and tRNA A37
MCVCRSLLRDLNDSDDDARRIVELTSGIPCKINLVRFNPHDGAEFFPSSLQVSFSIEFRNRERLRQWNLPS